MIMTILKTIFFMSLRALSEIINIIFNVAF